MSSFFQILAAITPVFMVMIAGGVARKVKWLTPEGDGPLLRLVINLLYPALILRHTLGNTALADPRNLLLPPLTGFSLILLGFALCWWVAPLFGIKGGPKRRTFSFTTGLQNYGYMAIPLLESLFNDPNLLGVLFVHNVGVEVAFWTVGVLIVSGAWNRNSWKKVFNPPVLALAVGLILNLTGIGANLPKFVLNGIDFLGYSSIPLGLMLAGASVVDLMHGDEWRRDLRVPLGACLMRLGLLPLLFLLTASLIPFSVELKQIIVVQAAMPAAMMPIVIARHYGGDGALAVKVVLGTTLLSLITIPLWVSLGLRLLGL